MAFVQAFEFSYCCLSVCIIMYQQLFPNKLNAKSTVYVKLMVTKIKYPYRQS